MFGKIRHFSCKKCGKAQVGFLSITHTFYINGDTSREFLPLTCESCGEKQFVIKSGFLVPELTDEAKRTVWERQDQTMYISYNHFATNKVFILESEGIHLLDEVDSYESAGISAF